MEPVFAAIGSLLKEIGHHEEVTAALVFAAWDRHAGEMLRRQTKPLEYADRRLVVAVRDETWQNHLQAVRSQMIYKLNRELGDGTVEFIDFRADRRAAPAEVSRPAATSPDGELPTALKRAAGAIADDGLRRRFLEAASAYLNKH